MYILGIETTGAFASVALTKDGRVIGHVRGNDRFSHLQNLMPQVESVIKENKLSIGDISALAVSCGPGSFTGIRIGVSSARALSQILDIPCASVSSLEALAMRVCESDNLNDIVDKKVLVCPILDARRSQVYGAGYYV
ncbi:MAG: tRNA (adenosine(37)-N6)-threonylcarbamoyltransferase complex dimerization subunit type 1 TsaB, partial [Anaerovoracaceae bacterium]